MRITILLISYFIGSSLFPHSTFAIPMSGDYVFVSGDPNISGGFKSTGGSISAWSFSSDILDRLFFGSPNPTTQSWNGATDIQIAGHPISNDANIFATNNGSAVDSDPCCYAVFVWNNNPSILNASFAVHPTFHDAFYVPTPIVSFVVSPSGSISIPDSSTVLFLAAGLVGLVVYQRRHRGRLYPNNRTSSG